MILRLALMILRFFSSLSAFICRRHITPLSLLMLLRYYALLLCRLFTASRHHYFSASATRLRHADIFFRFAMPAYFTRCWRVRPSYRNNVTQYRFFHYDATPDTALLFAILQR